MSDPDNSIFNSQATPEQTNSGTGNNTAPSQDSDLVNTLLGSIKNENGQPKYGNTGEALKALKHSQEFIPQLQNENATLKRELEQLRMQVEKLKGVEEVVERLASNQTNASTNANTLDEKSIADLVQRTLSQREVEAIQKANVTAVVTSLQGKFGQEAEKSFYAKAQELGMSVQQMNALAATSPQAVLQLFGVQKQGGSTEKMPSSVASSVNTTGFETKQDSFVGRNTKRLEIGATDREQREELEASRKMLEELEKSGMSVDDLSKPSNYFKLFR